MRRQRRAAVLRSAAIALVLLTTLGAFAESSKSMPQQQTDEPSGRAQLALMQRVGGIIMAINGAQVTIKTVDGAVYQVATTDNTRVMRGRGVPGKLADLKAGDGLMALGNLDAPNKTLHAAILVSMDAEQMKKIEEARRQQLANLGKTFIAGRVTAVDLDNATLTLERPDGISQTIGFDEGTSFRRGRPNWGGGAGSNSESAAATPAPDSESITLADIKIGDRVAGHGEVKGGRFVPRELNVMTPGTHRHHGSGDPANGTGAAQAAPK